MSPSKSASGKFKHAAHTAWRRVEKESIILDLNTSAYYSLNETGAFVWERLGAGAEASRLASEICAEFDVDPATAKRDVDELIQELCKEKLLVPA